MALATAPSFSSFDVTSRTEGRSVDSVLWDAMFAKSRGLSIFPMGPKIDQQRHEWISLAAPVQTVTEANSGSTTVDSSASGTTLVVSSGEGAKVMEGTLLVNSSIATPIGTYQRNEILQVTAVSTDTLTVVRDIGAFNAGTGFATHALTNVYRILYTPHQEGSVASLDPNTYSADSILENYTAIKTIKMQLTGSQKARAMEVVDSEVERQWQRELLRLKNEEMSQFLYGFNSATAVGSDTVIRNSKGIQDFMVDNIVAANPLIDYTTTTLTYDAINALFIKLFNNGADPSQDFKILCPAVTKDVISSWEADKVRTTIDTTQVGREITQFKSTLGFNAEVIADPMVQKSDLFIVDPAKTKIIPFRPFEKQEWGKGTAAPNGDDMWYQRTIGEHTLQVNDPGTGHAMLTYLTWI